MLWFLRAVGAGCTRAGGRAGDATTRVVGGCGARSGRAAGRERVGSADADRRRGGVACPDTERMCDSADLGDLAPQIAQRETVPGRTPSSPPRRPSPPAQRAGAADDRPSPTPSFGKPSFSGWHCYACDSLAKNHRRHRGIQRPWRTPCSGSLGAGVALIAGFHVLALPCLPLGATLAVEALHLLGLALYFYIVVRSDAVDAHCRAARTEPDDGLRYCPYCRCFVSDSPRVKHCHECRKCVDGFDHHCVFLQACVGRRNYNAFLGLVATLFLWTATLLALDVALVAGAGNEACRIGGADAAAARHRRRRRCRRRRAPGCCGGTLRRAAPLGVVRARRGAHAARRRHRRRRRLGALHCYLVATKQTTFEWITARRRRLHEAPPRARSPRAPPPASPTWSARCARAGARRAPARAASSRAPEPVDPARRRARRREPRRREDRRLRSLSAHGPVHPVLCAPTMLRVV